MAEEDLRIFISYSRDDSEFALRLARDLKSTGAPVWLDKLDISPGVRWDRATEAALVQCSRVLVILSPSSVRSDNVMDEVSFALEGGKLLIPVLFRDCNVPFRLRRVQYIDFRKEYETGINELCRTLRVESPRGEVQQAEGLLIDTEPRVGRPSQVEQENGLLEATERETSEIVGADAPSVDGNEHAGIPDLSRDPLVSTSAPQEKDNAVGPAVPHMDTSQSLEPMRGAVQGQGIGNWLRQTSILAGLFPRIGIRAPPIPNWSVLAIGVAAFATVSTAVLTLKREKSDLTAISGILEVHGTNGWSVADRAVYYHLSVGMELIPYTVLANLISVKTGKPLLQRMDRFGFLPDDSGPGNPRGLPIGLSLERSRNRVTAGMEMVGLTCSSCHVGEFTHHGKRFRVDGASSLVNLQAFRAELTESLEAILQSSDQLADLTTAMRGELNEVQEASMLDPTFHAVPSKIADTLQRGVPMSAKNAIAVLKLCLERLKSSELAGEGTETGPGRVDTFRAVGNLLFPEHRMRIHSPVKFPLLWSVPQAEERPSQSAHIDWIQFDGSTNSVLEQNIAQAIGMGLAINPNTFESTLRVRNLHSLEILTRRLQIPTWPATVLGTIDEVKARIGEQIFQRKCQGCHDDRLVTLQEVGTDPNRASDFGQPNGGKPFPSGIAAILDGLKRRAIQDDEMSVEEQARIDTNPVVWRATSGYLARTLKGVWAAAPYLHNGSIPTLWELLNPDQRPTRFGMGSHEYDAVKLGLQVDRGTDGKTWTYDTSYVGNSNAGHVGESYGTTLPLDQKVCLMEYLKTR